MSLIRRLISAVLNRPDSGNERVIRGSYDAARTTTGNSRHWVNTDPLSADAAGSIAVRKTLRERGRYEVANNPYARGLLHGLANYIIGTGPRLDLTEGDREDNEATEYEFALWCEAVDLAGKLRTARMSQCESGECFLQMTDNQALPTPVTLDLQLIEADQVATPPELMGDYSQRRVDGIRFDAYGNPAAYYVLRYHPGDLLAFAIPGLSSGGYREVSAAVMIHLYRVERPGQNRGISELAAGLTLFAQLRRYSQAVLDAAEAAARLNIIMKTTGSPEDGAAEVPPGMTMEFERDMMTFTPDGWEPFQVKAEQPTQMFVEVRNHWLAELGRVCQVPRNIITGDSSDSNFASGRLDVQAFTRFIDTEQRILEHKVLNRIFAAWRREASLIEGYLPQSLRTEDEPSHQWTWPAIEHVDQKKDADAAATRLESGVSSLAIECARSGYDCEAVQMQQADYYGVSLEQYRKDLYQAHLKKLGGAATPAQASGDPANQDTTNQDSQTAVKNAA